MPAKKGRFSRAELDFVKDNIPLGHVEVAKRLNRTPESIRLYMRDLSDTEGAAAKEELRSSIAWRQLKDEFDAGELEYFEEKYARYLSQFKEDVMETEDTQIFLVIKLEIMMHRNVVAKRRAKMDIGKLIRQQEEYEKRLKTKKNVTDQDQAFLLELEGLIQSARAAEASKTAEFIKLEEKHQALMKDLKATRDQRVNRIESSKVSWLGVLKQLNDEESRDRMGRHMDLMKKVSDKEFARLGGLTQYADGTVDRPILSADTSLAQEE